MDAAEADLAFRELERHGRARLAAQLGDDLGAVLPEYQPLSAALAEMLKGQPSGTPAQTPSGGRFEAARKLLDACLDGLPAVLTGRLSYMDVMFPKGSMSLVEGVYRDNDATDYYNALLGTAIAEFVKAQPKTAPVRILEIGAGTGSATSSVLAALEPLGRRIEFVFTDVSQAFVTHAESRFGQRKADLIFRVLDIEKDPAGQGFEPGCYDLILASNVLHATRRIHETLRHVKSLLRTNGLLVMNEVTEVRDFATMTFGLTSGWWRFEDKARRLPHSPLLSVDGWRAVLNETGFRGCAAFGADGQKVIVAESDGWIKEMEGIAAKPEAVATPSKPTVQADEAALDYARRMVAEVLKLDLGALDPESNFERFGVDSLVVMELQNRLEKDLGPLPKTLLFENVTLTQLARTLQSDHALALQRHLGIGPSEPVATPETRDQRPEIRDQQTADIAVIGMSGRFPGADNIREFWKLLAEGRDAVVSIPPERWDHAKYYDADGGDPAKCPSRSAALIRDVDKFDPLFFGISPQEAECLDPQERLFLQEVWSAIEDAGYTPKRLSQGGSVGVYVGVMNADYGRIGVEDWAHGGLGGATTNFWSVANRVSYFFDFTGPSMAVDSACSSSLTAIHLACQSLRSGETRVAIAGGVNLMLHPLAPISLGRMGMLSRSGVTRAFGADADGFVKGEAIVSVILKRLEDAVADHDRICGVIKATAVNSGGRTTAYMLPNPSAQAGVIADCLRQAGIDPRTLSHVESQAVGSLMGDSIEVRGLTKAFEQWTRDRQFCTLGSLKPNIGHLEAASGVAQLVKLLLQLQHRQLAPTIHTGTPNPDIQFENSPFRIQTRLSPWTPSSNAPLRAGISAFGAGGANAHMIVEEAGSSATILPIATHPHLIVLSARDPEQLRQRARDLARFLDEEKENPNFEALACTLQLGREAMRSRLAFVAVSLEEARTSLSSYLAEDLAACFVGEARSSGNLNRARLTDLARQGSLTEVAALWVQGAEVGWEKLWPDTRPRPLSLPTYPFVKRRCWIEPARPPQSKPGEEAPEPCIGVVVRGVGEVEDLNLEKVQVPPPGPGELQLQVKAFALNFADLLCMRGLYPNLPEYPFTPGFEVSGIVVAAGADATSRIGEEVIALTKTGGHATLVNVPGSAAVRKPANLNFEEACSIPIAYLTMRQAFDRAGVMAGERVLIQTAAGGTGLIGVQLALRSGAEVIATTGSRHKSDYLRGLGVAHVINYRETDFANAVREITKGEGVDVVFNTLSGDAIQKGLNLLRPGGRYVELALTGLKALQGVDLSRFMDNQSLFTVNLGRLMASPEATRLALERMASDFESGAIWPKVDKVFPLSEIREAYRFLSDGKNIGKVVVSTKSAAAATIFQPIATPRNKPSVTRSQIRAHLLETVCSVLKLEPGELKSEGDCRFSDLGVNSMSGVGIMREVQRKWGAAVPVVALWEHPTIEALAIHLAEVLKREPSSTTSVEALRSLVTIRGQGTQPPSFWVHGAPGEVSWAANLAEALGNDYPVYAFESKGLRDASEPIRQIESMAQRYVSELLEAHPSGAYWLGGYSLGGAVAFEMARQLAAAGRPASRLILLDAFAPESSALQGMGEALGEGFIFHLATNWFGELWGSRKVLGAAEMKDLPKAAALERAVEHLFTHASPPLTKAEVREHLTRMDSIGAANGQALASYRPTPYEGPLDVLLIRCREGLIGERNRFELPAFFAGDYRAGWERLAPGPIRRVDVQCEHFELAIEPFVRQVAAAIRGEVQAEDLNGLANPVERNKPA